MLRKKRYKRADGIDLTATVYLPSGYDKDRDGRLPVIMWAYPREYRSASDAEQVRGLKYTFTNINYGSPVFFSISPKARKMFVQNFIIRE